MLERQNQNDAAHSSTVGMMAYQLQRAFRAYPDDKGQSIIERIFAWVCGKPVQQAIVDKDDRTINIEGVSDSKPAFWSEETQEETERQELFEAGEEVGSFFSNETFTL